MIKLKLITKDFKLILSKKSKNYSKFIANPKYNIKDNF